jgi:hypothetical protein
MNIHNDSWLYDAIEHFIRCIDIDGVNKSTPITTM